MEFPDFKNHYWLRADGTLFSSAATGYVAADHPSYVAWLASGNIPTAYPRDSAGAESQSELAAVLIAAGCRDAAAALDLKTWAKAELSRTDLEWGGRLADDAIALFNGTPLSRKAQDKFFYRAALRSIIDGTIAVRPTDPMA